VGVDFVEEGLIDAFAGGEAVLLILEIADKFPAPEACAENDVCDRDGQGAIFTGDDG
tara:strand:- start:63 stop:233 length:171 start_codon:yes stop_codon:yes gene_type:complete